MLLSWSGRPARPRPTALLSPSSDGKPEAATAVVVAPDDGHEDARNMLNCILTTSNKLEKLLQLVGWLVQLKGKRNFSLGLPITKQMKKRMKPCGEMQTHLRQCSLNSIMLV